MNQPLSAHRSSSLGVSAPSEAEVVRASPRDSASDFPAFREIFDLHADLVWRTLRRLGVPEASVDDALQDVFLVVHQKVASFEGRAQLSTWIYSVAYRVAQNYRRKALKHRHEEVEESFASASPDPAAVLAEGQAARFVQSFCNGLDENQRDAFVLCVLEGRSAPEVVELLGVKLNTVYSRARSTRAQFRTALLELKSQVEGSRQ